MKFRKINRLDLEYLAIDQKGRRAGKTQTIDLGDAGINDRLGLFVVEACVELGGVKTDLCRIAFQVRLGVGAEKLAAMLLEKLVVIFPELALHIRALGGVRCPVRFVDTASGANVNDRIILVREFHFSSFNILLIDLALRAKCKIAAVWSLKVRVFGKIDFRVGVAFGATGGSGTRASGHLELRCLYQEKCNPGKYHNHTNTQRICPSWQAAVLLGLLGSCSAR